MGSTDNPSNDETSNDETSSDETSSAQDAVFKALADPTRRRLLDGLRARDGQTLGELCSLTDMARQSVTQHLDVLAGANLVSVVRRGRERLHHLNPVPIHAIQSRWISAFDLPRLEALEQITNQAEEHAMTNRSDTVPSYVYVTYIRATDQQVWQALTDADLTARYWGHANVSDWQTGSRWEHRRTDGSQTIDVDGTVIERDEPNRLVITFGEPGAAPDDQSLVTFLIEPHDDIVRLTVTHDRLASDDDRQEIANGWPAVLANLKSLLETGDTLPQSPWEMQQTG